MILAPALNTGYAAESVAHFARCASLDDTQKGALDRLIKGLLVDGVWQLLDVLCVPKSTSADSLKNLCSSNFDATLVNAPTFTAYEGYNCTETGGGKYINSNYTSTHAAAAASLTSCSFFVYRRTASDTSSAADFGGDASDKFHLKWNPAPDIAAHGKSQILTGTKMTGLSLLTRTDIVTSSWYGKNAADDATAAGSNSAKAETGITVYVGAINDGSPDAIAAEQFSCWGGGLGMTALQVHRLFSRIHEYMAFFSKSV